MFVLYGLLYFLIGALVVGITNTWFDEGSDAYVDDPSQAVIFVSFWPLIVSVVTLIGIGHIILKGVRFVEKCFNRILRR